MNKIFKVIWNPATGSYTVASETAKSRGKKSGRSKLLISALVVGGLLSSGVQASTALDGGGASESTPLTDTWIAIGQGAKASSVDTSPSGGPGTSSIAIGQEAQSGIGSTSLGFKSQATGERSVALGQTADATGNRAIAIGSGAKSTADYSLTLGNGSKAFAENATAIGKDARAEGKGSQAFGKVALATGENAIALGSNSNASGDNAVALGSTSQAYGDSSLAIGELSETNAENAIALGKLSNASKINSIALGSNSTASGVGSVALGENSFAGGINSLALGSQSNANGDNAVALGVGSVAEQDNTVSVGNSTTQRKITNMAAGLILPGSTEAINGSQLHALSASVAARLGAGAGVNGDGSINAPSYKLKSGTYNNVGEALLGIDNDTLHWDKTEGAFSASYIVKNADGSPKSSIAQNKIINVAKGTISATSTDVVNGSQLYDLQQDALLWNGTAFSAAHGSDTTSKITNVAKGTVSATSTDVVNGSQLYDLQQDALLWNGTAFSAAHGTEATSKITNVEDGTISDTSKDAVNGSQLKETKDDVATNTANIATNTTDIATNTANIADNTADIATNTTDIATNTANIATNTTDIATNTADIATNASSITTLNADVDTLEKDALLWNGTAFSAKHGTEATSKITNVTAGDLTAGSTDAVNGSQLKTTNDNVSTNTTNITNLTDSVGDLKDDSLLWNKTAGAFSAAHGTEATSKITNLLAGKVSSDSTDAINGSQLYGVADSFTSYLGGGADISDTGVLTGPTYTIGGTDYTNVGDALAAINTSFSSSLGDALLWDATAGKFSAKHGINNDPSVITDVANGAVSSTSSDAINGSQLYDVSDYIADALGGNAVVNADGSITTPTYAIAGGSYDNVGDALEAIDTTLDDALLWDETANGGNGAFSAAHGKDKTASVITNVANGAVSATSSDAINGSQLYSTNKYIADALGGDAEVNADGTITAPTYTIANTDYNNVGEALDALDNNALLWDEDAGAYNASHDGNASKITNVAAGDLSTTSTDAVNGSQLNATNILVTQNSQMINQLAGNTSETYIEENGAGINYVRTNDSGLAFNDASAAGIGSTAVGYNSVADGDNSVAIGHGSNSIVETSIALGSESVSSRVIVKGSRNTSVSEEGVVIGYDTTDGELLGALSIGDDGKYRQIINVADGSEAHDAVTVRQLQNAIGAVATTPTKYYHANSTAEDSLAVGEDSLAMGAKTIVNGNAGIGIGLNTLVLADAINGIAIGSNARANHADSIAMGNGSQTTRGAQTNYTAYNMDAPQNSVGEFSVGSEDGQRQITNVAAGSADTDAVNVGQLKVTDAQVSQNTQSITNLNTQVTNLDTRVTNIENGIGDIVTTGSTKYFKTNTDGADANAQGKDSVAIGSGSIAAADNSVALGTGSVADEENTISVGSSTNQRRITNVAAGVNATDAVNVSQLKSSEAGGVRYDTKADGSIDYSNITLGGGNGGTTRISNVSAGVNNNDAVNYAQLKQSVQETKQYTDQRMVEMDNKLSKTESKLSGGIASAMAMTGLPQAYTPGASMASIGGGTYNGESAVALGVSMVSANGRWVYKLQGSTNSQGEYSAALGAGIQW
ncbi:YadA-like family protein [Escherichia coli]|uniref:YadA-like family protein n=1 Tax=Escherichia coli TaxID=562 RepID=UPI00053A8CC0|nr:YadA-like family protein [Escherichia coli]EFW8104805.1 adhesin [Shigella sonnei]EIG6217697.1 YadA-like family protein [Shigella dysenteriae]EIH4990773.1 YadA-like family protein [Shigella boydii]HDL6813174.1 YadA-like family protein [Escherichia coli 371_08]HDL6817623.1 YadA-like family protein [Escherichia coli 290_10]HDL6832937.1 YadA-like family protein [Escherichia coli 229_11]HDL7560725.1 YadA-like family protein [Escherichia coli 151_06]